MDSRNAAFENYWASQWVDFDDAETTERRERIAKAAFVAGWSASLTDEVQDSIRSTACADADGLAEALAWYEKWVGECNKDGPEGNIARDRLAKDVGNTARDALAAHEVQS